ncbi:MAG: hypothetical protein RIB63_04105, partial [Fulvivirga sp.]
DALPISSTANFISGLYKSVPPLQEMFNMAGMDLPEYLKGKSPEEIKLMAEKVVEEKQKPESPTAKPTQKSDKGSPEKGGK